MKQFIKELKTDWTPVKYAFNYKYYWQGRGKYILRSFLVQLNREISLVATQLLTNPSQFLLLILSIILGYFLYIFVGLNNLSNLFSTLTGFVISFISVLVAAAIFISTLHRRATNDSMESDKEFLGTLTKYKGELKDIYAYCYDDASDEQRIKMFKAVASNTVIDYSDYPAYKEWHLANLKNLNELKIESYDQYIKFPYDAAMSTSWSRSFYIREGCEVIDQLITSQTRKSKEYKAIAKDLIIAAKKHEQNGWGSYYIPVEFVGKRLIRVVIYSLIAVSLMLVLGIRKDMNTDFVPEINFMFNQYLTILTIVFCVCSIFLIIRYVFKFMAYLRDSTAYGTSRINTLYIHEPDASMRMANEG